MVLQQSYTYTCYTINHLVIERRAVSLPVTLTADGFSSCPAISLILTQWRSLRPGLHRAESRGRCCLNSSTRTFICTHKHAHTNSNKTKYVLYTGQLYLLGHAEGIGLLPKVLLQFVELSPDGSHVVLHHIRVHGGQGAVHPRPGGGGR